MIKLTAQVPIANPSTNVSFSMFDFTSVHLCQKHIIEMGKLGCFGLCFVRSLLRKQPSLFDVRFLMYAVNTYIKVEFDVEYFQ